MGEYKQTVGGVRMIQCQSLEQREEAALTHFKDEG